MANSDIKTEVLRQLVNVEGTYLSYRETREDDFAAQRAQGLHGKMLSTLAGAAECALVLGQARWCLARNSDDAAAIFGSCAEWMGFFDEAMAERTSPGGEVGPFMPVILLDPLVAFILSGNEELARRFCSGVDESLFFEVPKLRASDRQAASFTLGLVRMLSGRSTSASELGEDSGREPPESPTAGYGRLLSALNSRDSTQVADLLAELSGAYRKRAEVREPALNPWGFGKVAQAATFDALGTAVCRAAGWQGMDISLDSELHPSPFLK